MALLAKLAISLGGTAPGSDYGHIHFSNPLIIIGTFSVSTRSGFVPSPGDTFDVLSYRRPPMSSLASMDPQPNGVRRQAKRDAALACVRVVSISRPASQAKAASRFACRRTP